MRHIETGGDPDATFEALVDEVLAEHAAGQHYSHTPGRA
jgi:hypothetical protein